jgi:V8-like Glu-specific endopeptidase
MEQFQFYSGMNIESADKDVWTNMYTATLTTGIVSGERTSAQGTRYYQTDAAVDSGSSGGPVCNDQNQVIGVVVIGFDKQGFNFFLPSEYISEMCKKNGVSVGGSILPF